MLTAKMQVLNICCSDILTGFCNTTAMRYGFNPGMLNIAVRLLLK